jgi:hypothetical protein
MAWKTQPVCDDCWDTEHPDRPSPRKGQGHLEQCCQCGAATRSGIYVRLETGQVKFPQEC